MLRRLVGSRATGRARAALLWLGLVLPACYGGVALPVKHQRMVFVDERRLLLVDEREELGTPTLMAKPVVVAYDFVAARELWRSVVSARNLDPSANGKFVLVLDKSATPLALAGVLEVEHGKFSDLKLALPDPNGRAGARDLTSISDDGTRIASILDQRLSVWALPGGDLVYQQSFGADRPVAVSFVKGGHNLWVQLVQAPTFDATRAAVVVLAHGASGWQLDKRFDDLPAFDWTARGLLFVSDQGISRYDGHAMTLLVKGLAPAGARFSADGRYVGYRGAAGGLEVYDLDSQRVVLTSQWWPRVHFHDHYVSAMSDGKLWRGDLSNGSSTVLHDFGKASETVKIPFFGGTTSNTNYLFALNREGTLLYYLEPGRRPSARVFVIDDF